MMKATLLLMVFVMLSGVCFWFGFEAPADHGSEDLPAFLEKVRARNGLPALAAACITSEGIYDMAAVGVRRNDEAARVSPADRFHLGSITKSITALAIAQCVRQGKISWDTHPTVLFKGLKDSIHPGYNRITLRSLLNHSAGIPAYTGDGEFERAPISPGTGPERRRAFSVWLLRQPPASEPGSFVYSNAGYTLATAMAEQATGMAWKELVTKKVFEPLHLDTAGFGWPNQEDSAQPWGHGSFTGSDQCWPLAPDHEWKLNELSAPAGDVHMSIEDLARYAQYHLRALSKGNPASPGCEAGYPNQGGVKPGHGFAFPSLKATIPCRNAAHPERKTPIPADLIADLHKPFGPYGLGWYIDDEDGLMRSFHSGSAGTFLASIEIIPSRNIAVAFVCNARTDSATKACTLVMQKLMRRELCSPCRFLSESRDSH